MSASASIDFRLVSATADLPRIMESEGITVRRGKAFCPFHDNQNTPALSVYERNGVWAFKCHSCGESGDALDWVAKRDGVSLAEAAQKLDPMLVKERRPKASERPPTAKPLAWHTPEWQAKTDALVREAEETLWSAKGRAALGWLRGRGLEDHTITRFRLGFLPAETNGHARGILIPWLAPGAWYGASSDPDCPRWVGANVRRLMPDVNQPWEWANKCMALQGSSRGYFYPWPDILEPQALLPALIVEGEFDALLASQEAGWMAHVGTVGGATQKPHETALVALGFCPRWLIATDNDEAGNEAAWGWHERAPHKARRVTVPTGKDIGDFVEAGGDVAAWLASELEAHRS